MLYEKKVIFLDKTHPVLQETLDRAGYHCTDASSLSRSEVLEVMPDFEGLIVRSRIRIDRELMERSPKLEFIGRSGVGLEHIDLDCAEERGIAVLPSPEGSRNTVGEHTIGLLLCLLNNLARADREVRKGEWIREGNRGVELQGLCVGIIGYGNMGTAFARRLSGFGCRVLAYDKFKDSWGDAHAEEAAMETLFELADVVSLHIPYSPGNRYLANAAWINRFRKNIWLVNTSRGMVLNTADLVDGLQSGKIRGAALDVIEYEEMSFAHLDPERLPAPFQYLRQAPNVVLSPHIAGWSDRSEYGHALALAEKITASFAAES